MEIEKIKITDIKPAEYNPRSISSEELTKLTNSINAFGLVDPIIINLKNNKIIGGHQRYEVLINQYMLNNDFYAELNLIRMGDIGWIFTETDLTVEDEDHEKALNLALNKISGEWDFEKLTELLDELDLNGFDISLSGFDGLDDLDFDLDGDYNPDEDEYEIEDDNYEEPDDLEVTVKYGDIYELGNHRLLCGDATSKDDIKKLMEGNKADITFTSPPYNAQRGATFVGDFNSYYKNDDCKVYKNTDDNLTDEEYSKLLINSAKQALKYSDDVLYNIGILQGSKIGITNLLYELQENLSDILIWEKSTALPLGLEPQRKMVSHKAELIFCFNQKGNRSFSHSQWDKGTKTNIITTNNNNNNEYANIHKAMFPLEFASEIIKDFTDNSVLDLFGGLGTTLIACEQLNRKCYIMEIDPYYCQVIIQRWETYTGQKATKIRG